MPSRLVGCALPLLLSASLPLWDCPRPTWGNCIHGVTARAGDERISFERRMVPRWPWHWGPGTPLPSLTAACWRGPKGTCNSRGFSASLDLGSVASLHYFSCPGSPPTLVAPSQGVVGTVPPQLASTGPSHRIPIPVSPVKSLKQSTACHEGLDGSLSHHSWLSY